MLGLRILYHKEEKNKMVFAGKVKTICFDKTER